LVFNDFQGMAGQARHDKNFLDSPLRGLWGLNEKPSSFLKTASLVYLKNYTYLRVRARDGVCVCVC
jgi:hypothetical protein